MRRRRKIFFFIGMKPKMRKQNEKAENKSEKDVKRTKFNGKKRKPAGSITDNR